MHINFLFSTKKMSIVDQGKPTFHAVSGEGRLRAKVDLG